jgi:uncharacterized protein
LGYNKGMSKQRQEQLAQALDHILHVLEHHYQPEQVILFGSMAGKAIGEWSDIDLAIVMDTSLPFIDRSVEVALLCRAGVGVDYFVYTPDEFAQMIAQGNHFILNEVLAKGKVIYERDCTATMA